MQQKSSALEYSSDYRTAERQANKVTIKANTKPKSCPTEAYFDDTLQESFDTISTSRTTTRKIGLYRVVFACVMLILAIAGVTGLLSALSRTAAVVSNSPSNAKYGSYIAPVVMHDPPPFDDSSHLDANVKIAASIWRNIFQKGASTYKEIDADGLTLMPASDVQSACTELFGPNATINTDESVHGQFFSHTAGDDCFHIRATSNAASLVPHVDDITEDNEALNLVVSYFSRDEKKLKVGDNKAAAPSPVKRMVYNLRLNEGSKKYYIHSVSRTYS